MAPKADKFGKQIRYADRRRIPYVWFGAPPHSEIKDIRTGEQLPADPDRWEPDAADLRPTVSGPARTARVRICRRGLRGPGDL